MAGTLAALILLVVCIYINEARKEVEVMCTQFSAGTSDASLFRQLETLSLSFFRTDTLTGGTRQVIIASPYTLGIHRCEIRLDTAGLVEFARGVTGLPFL